MIPAVVGWFASWLGVSAPSTLATAEALVLGGVVLGVIYAAIVVCLMVIGFVVSLVAERRD